MKKYIWLIFLFLIIANVYGVAYRKFYFFNEANQPVNNILVIGWKCVDYDCTQVSTMIPQLSPNGINTGNNNYIDITFPENNQRYLVYFLHTNYISKNFFTTTPVSGGRGPDVYFNSETSFGPFRKKPNCRAPSSLSVSNKIGEWLPLTIDTSTQLDSETSSAIRFITNTYYPPDEQYQQYVQVATDVILTIKDKKTNQVVFTETKRLNIPWDKTKSASFTFGPSNSNYKAGNYTVDLRTRVVDSKCSSQVDDVKTQDIEIFPRLPDDACIIIAEPISIPSNSVNNQQININVPAYYYHLKKSYDSDYNLHLTYTGITSNYLLNLKDRNNQIRTFTGTFPKSFNDIRYDSPPTKPLNIISWLPNTYGNYEATITLTSSDTLCQGKQNDFSRGTRTDTFTIMPRDQDNDNYKEDTDCNDNNPYINPGMSDISCDGVDQNCDGVDRTPDIPSICK